MCLVLFQDSKLILMAAITFYPLPISRPLISAFLGRLSNLHSTQSMSSTLYTVDNVPQAVTDLVVTHFRVVAYTMGPVVPGGVDSRPVQKKQKIDNSQHSRKGESSPVGKNE